MNFRPDIQGLRAIAVLAVMIFHLNPAWLPGGFVGVDIFLVISGFLISSILLHKKAKPDYSLRSTLSYFYSSRLKRIVPAYFTTLIVVSLVAAVLFLPSDFNIYRDGLKKAVYFNSNNYFANFGDYFAPANHEQPLLHTWSLAIEIQFYLIAPFIFLLVPRRVLRWLLPAAILLLTGYAEYQLRTGSQQATYYSLIARLPAFFIGGSIALWIDNQNNLRGGDSRKLWVSSIATGLVLAAFATPDFTGYFPGIAGLVPTAAAALIIWHNANNKLTALLSVRVMVWIGALSYSLYLWHWPVLAFMRYYTGAEILGWGYGLAFVVLTFGLATASYYWVETPLRLRRSAKQLIGYACLLLVVVGAKASMKGVNDSLTPERLPIEYRRYADPAIICHGKIVGDCLQGDLASDKEVLVLGDSHAAMLNHFFDYLGKELGFKARVITASSCITIPEFDYQRIPEYAQAACMRQISQAEKYIDQAVIIVVAGKWSWHYSSDMFNTAFERLLEGIRVDQKLLVLGQVPFLDQDPNRIQRFNILGISPDQKLSVGEHLNANSKIASLTSGYAENIVFFDTSHAKVFSKPPFFNKKMIYQDRHHLNEVGSTLYAKEASLHKFFKGI